MNDLVRAETDAQDSDEGVNETLKRLYAEYRHTVDIDDKGHFFSPLCKQICRPRPSYAAKNRETIVGYLHDVARQGTSAATGRPNAIGDKPAMKGYYTIRSLEDSEVDFAADDQVRPAGFNSAEEVRQMALAEGWVGMRVDLWEGDGLGDNGDAQGLLVKVTYWWRKEDGVWLQILHDIMYMGPRDGTEGVNGEVLE